MDDDDVLFGKDLHIIVNGEEVPVHSCKFKNDESDNIEAEKPRSLTFEVRWKRKDVIGIICLCWGLKGKKARYDIGCMLRYLHSHKSRKLRQLARIIARYKLDYDKI